MRVARCIGLWHIELYLACGSRGLAKMLLGSVSACAMMRSQSMTLNKHRVRMKATCLIGKQTKCQHAACGQRSHLHGQSLAHGAGRHQHRHHHPRRGVQSRGPPHGVPPVQVALDAAVGTAGVEGDVNAACGGGGRPGKSAAEGEGARDARSPSRTARAVMAACGAGSRSRTARRFSSWAASMNKALPSWDIYVRCRCVVRRLLAGLALVPGTAPGAGTA